MEAYLSFDGNCAAAFAFYEQALGGKTIFSMSFGESPMGEQTPADYKDKVMHATFEARGHKIMGSDM
ncbi:MAG: VOC family protein, partial [Variovorax sp.]